MSVLSNSMSDLVSIITPTFNCARFIRETIESVQAQSYEFWEMLIVDDCSEDDTQRIVEEYQAIDNRIKYYRLDKSSGAAIARNYAIRRASGKWIAFLDSDDLWDKDKLKIQLEFMKNSNYAFSYTAYREITENSHFNGREIYGPRQISRLGMLAYCWPGCLTVMFNADKVPMLQIPDIRKNNDYMMWLYLSERLKCGMVSEVLASYRKRTGSISNHSKASLIQWHYQLFRKYGFSVLKSIFCTSINLICGLYKKAFYVKTVS